jgi:hypothetical protein
MDGVIRNVSANLLVTGDAASATLLITGCAAWAIISPSLRNAPAILLAAGITDSCITGLIFGAF